MFFFSLNGLKGGENSKPQMLFYGLVGFGYCIDAFQVQFIASVFFGSRLETLQSIRIINIMETMDKLAECL